MTQVRRWKSSDLDQFPDDDGKRYEIIDGELHVSKTPSYGHQIVGGRVFSALDSWSLGPGSGVAIPTPGLIFADDQDVVPDAVWISAERYTSAIDQAGHLRVAPELVVEVLSPGSSNERRDRELKRSLYSRRGVSEYWIIDWLRPEVQVYRLVETVLQLEGTFREEDVVTSPLLPGFRLPVADLFIRLPRA
jgi:Uma2 family endonuclease